MILASNSCGENRSAECTTNTHGATDTDRLKDHLANGDDLDSQTEIDAVRTGYRRRRPDPADNPKANSLKRSASGYRSSVSALNAGPANIGRRTALKRGLANYCQSDCSTVLIATEKTAKYSRKPQSQKPPLVGHRREITVLVGNKPTTMLSDTGAGTSLIAAHRAQALNLKTYKTRPIAIKGATSDNSARCTEATILEFKYQNQQFEIPVYVTTAINPDIIIGNPVLETNPRLGQTLDRSSINLATPETEPDWPIGLILTNEDRQVRRFHKKQNRTLSGYIVQVQAIECCDATDTPDPSTFSRLPQYLQEKFRQTVRNDLPRSALDKKEIFHEIETKPNARMPRIPPHRRSPKEEGEIVKIVDELLEKGFIGPSKSPFSSPVVLVKSSCSLNQECIL
ncbi:hypothetical protein HG536_0G03400 [Torulaspora globosa]|uniref:Peptidase A2 domain-containing protein n=1 Tax=Torulaspora globosa TaxID=48254 RepID=A0A7G3ZLU2_9SACH|nr:uncharacterized protein HG536_0G03400 [Torulaspora globosa]QLL34478.1 hypothetical protein HG536_0G03400 [Torulaspora globosa]